MERDMRRPNLLFYTATCFFLRMMLLLLHRFVVRGLKRIPTRDPLIVVANHCSNIDPIVVGPSFPRRLRYLAKMELFRNSFFGFLIRNLGAIPVAREDSQRAGAVLKMLLELLDQGQSVLMFPEGHRSKDGKLQKLEGGFALLALKKDVTIVPALISGTFAAMPPGGKWRFFVPLRITYGEPIVPATVAPELSERERRQLLVDVVTERLEAMARVDAGE